MIFGDSGMMSLPRRSWYDPASTMKGPKRYDATIVIGAIRGCRGRPQHTPRRQAYGSSRLLSSFSKVMVEMTSPSRMSSMSSGS